MGLLRVARLATMTLTSRTNNDLGDFAKGKKRHEISHATEGEGY